MKNIYILLLLISGNVFAQTDSLQTKHNSLKNRFYLSIAIGATRINAPNRSTEIHSHLLAHPCCLSIGWQISKAKFLLQNQLNLKFVSAKLNYQYYQIHDNPHWEGYINVTEDFFLYTFNYSLLGGYKIKRISFLTGFEIGKILNGSMIPTFGTYHDVSYYKFNGNEFGILFNAGYGIGKRVVINLNYSKMYISKNDVRTAAGKNYNFNTYSVGATFFIK